jgi:hypothetical protein
MGLGLTISKMILQQMGGSIDVTSSFGHGSNFFFQLPIEEEPAAASGADGVEEGAGFNPRGREDEEEEKIEIFERAEETEPDENIPDEQLHQRNIHEETPVRIVSTF